MKQMSYDSERKQLFLDYLNRHTFMGWSVNEFKTSETYKDSLELIVSPVCNTKCTYCYYKNYMDCLYPRDIRAEKTILDNCRKLLEWVHLNEYIPLDVDIFSGEFFNLPYYSEILDIINTNMSHVKKDNPTGRITVTCPTNCTFCFSEEKTNEVQGVLDYYNNPNNDKSNIYIALSTSVDGKFLDNDTRPMRNGKQYDDEFYDRFFKFSARNDLCFHPMIGAKGIERWCDNFDWYVDNIMKYFQCSKIDAIRKIYLLEVRNPDWKVEEIEHFKKFITHYTDESFDAVDRDVFRYADEFLFSKGNSLFAGITGFCSRGMGCSIQQSFSVRLGDLALVPCHRTSYHGYNGCRLILEEGKKELDVELENPESYMLVNSFDSRTGVKCCDCPINRICNMYCCGTNFEVNKDFYLPVETVCDLQFAKAHCMATNLKRIGVLKMLTGRFASNSGFKPIAEMIQQLESLADIEYEEK